MSVIVIMVMTVIMIVIVTMIMSVIVIVAMLGILQVLKADRLLTRSKLAINRISEFLDCSFKYIF